MDGDDAGPVSAEYQKDLVLITELVSSEGQLGPTLRAVYDSEEAPSIQETFLVGLDHYGKRMDLEIERMCNKYYQGFIDSIEELLEVRPNANRLKELIVEAGTALAQSGQQLLQSNDDLVQWRAIQRNILIAIESLTSCLPVLRLYCKINSQLSARRYYPALKALQELENVHLPRVSKYTFAQRIRERVPMLRKRVKTAAHSEMQDFLANIRDRCGAIGEAAMKQIMSSQNAKLADMGNTEASTDLCASDMADFSPLYRCLHIYHVLGCRHECELYYREERKKQVQLVLSPTANMDSLTAYTDYFFQVAGFFLVEDTVLSTTGDLITRQWADDLWESAVSRLAGVLEVQLENCRTSETIYSVKQLIALFNQTLLGYGYNVGRLFDILLQVRERFTAVLLEQLRVHFDLFLSQDTLQPVTANSEEEYEGVLEMFPFDDRLFMEAPFPKTFPFSSAVPLAYTECRNFIDTTVKFVSDLDLSHTEVDEIVRKATNQLLLRTVGGSLDRFVEKCSSLPQLAQISINCSQWERACVSLEQYISNITHSREDEVHVTRLHGSVAFKDARQAAEDKIFSVLRNQIDDFCDLQNYNWAPGEEPKAGAEFVFDMLAYLTTIFASLSNQLRDVAKTAYLETCKYIARKLYAIVLSDEIKRYNTAGIRLFSLDLENCEQYANNCPLSGPGEELCRGVFEGLRELVNLFLSWDWSNFLDDVIRGRKYPLVNPEHALSILLRFDETEKKSFLFRSAEEKKRDKEKEGIVKRLRALLETR